MKTIKLVSLVAAGSVLAFGPSVFGSLNLVGSSPYSGPNLVANGSFENGHPGPGNANYQYWATGTGGTPFLAIPGWNGSGQVNNYASWGSDQTTGPYHTRQSDVLPDGQIGVYFGNGGGLPFEHNTVDIAPVFNPDFTVGFGGGSPTFSCQYGGPVILSQTIPTQLNPSPLYGLSFWVSGEGAQFNGGNVDGIFGIRLSNTLPGDPLLYLEDPSGSGSPMGASHFFQFEFQPLNPNLPVTLEFYNFGHLDLSGYGGPFMTTELVLDDVRVVTVPEPGSFALLSVGLFALGFRQRRRQT